jgi:hypothetical protein
LEFRNGLGDIYHQIFGRKGDDVSEQSEFAREWSWFATLDELAGSDVTKFEKVTELSMHMCLKKLCYNIDKRKMEERELKKIQQKYASNK